jgi:hypothetical protein
VVLFCTECECGVWKPAVMYISKDIGMSILGAFGRNNSWCHQTLQGILFGIEENLDRIGATEKSKTGIGSNYLRRWISKVL